MVQKLIEFENSAPDVSTLVKKTACNGKVSDNEKKYFITFDYNKFKGETLDVNIKKRISL